MGPPEPGAPGVPLGEELGSGLGASLGSGDVSEGLALGLTPTGGVTHAVRVRAATPSTIVMEIIDLVVAWRFRMVPPVV